MLRVGAGSHRSRRHLLTTSCLLWVGAVWQVEAHTWIEIKRNAYDERDIRLAPAPNVASLAEAASLAAGDRLGQVHGPHGA